MPLQPVAPWACWTGQENRSAVTVPPPLPWQVRTAPERLILVFAAAAAFVGALLWLAHYSGLGLSLCAWKGMTGLPCAGCGGTRSVAMLLHGDVNSALAMNPAAIVAVAGTLLLTIYAGVVVACRLEPLRPSFLRPKFWRFALLGLLVANWIYLLLAGRV